MLVRRTRRYAVLMTFAALHTELAGAGAGAGGEERLLLRRDAAESRVARFARAIVADDFDGDFLLDLLVASRATNGLSTLTLLSQRSARRFADPREFPIQERLTHLVAADLNRDGRPDLVTTHESGVSVRLGDGTGFVEGEFYPVDSAAPRFAAVADLVGDGFADLLIVETDAARVRLLRGAGDGSFAEGATLQAGAEPTSVTSADFDGDGDVDVVVCNRRGDSVTVFLNDSFSDDGGGGFSDGLEHSAGVARPFFVVAGQLGGGPLPDLALAAADAVTVLLDDRSGGFASPLVVPVIGTASSLGAVDLEPDGDLDLVVGFGRTDHVLLLRNVGDGAFQRERHEDLPRSETLVVDDLDGDGDHDLASAAGSAVSVVFQDGVLQAPLFAASTEAAGGTPHDISVGDLDGDSDLDVVTANNTPDPGISVFENLGDGVFAAFTGFGGGGTPFAIALADIDSDGDLDVAAADEGGGIGTNRLRVLLNDGGGAFSQGLEYATGGVIRHVTTGDLNGDGAPDLVTTQSAANNVTVLLNDGTGAFDRLFDLPVGAGPSAAAIADVDVDGFTDLVVANQTAAELSLFQGPLLQGGDDGAFAGSRSLLLVGKPSSVSIGDLDGDSLPDLVTADEATATVTVFWNDAAKGLAASESFLKYVEPHSVSTADIDGDGFLEVVTANQRSNTVSLLFFGGDRTLEGSVPYQVGMQPRFVVAADLDNNGATDLVSGNRGSLDITVLLNTFDGDGGSPSFRRGDVDSGGRADLVDVLRLLEYLFRKGAAPSCVRTADVNDDGIVNVLDAVRLARALWSDPPVGDPPVGDPLVGDPLVDKPRAVTNACIEDSTPDGLGCSNYPLCQ